MSTGEVDRLERYLDNRFNTLEDRVTKIEERIGGIEQDTATIRALSRLAAGVITILVATGAIAGISYLAK